MQHRFRSHPANAFRVAALVPFALAACAETSQTVLIPDALQLQANISSTLEWSAATAVPFANVNTPTATEGCLPGAVRRTEQEWAGDFLLVRPARHLGRP